MKKKKPTLSIVIPAHNEAGNVTKLHTEIVEVCEKMNKGYEILFVNDGSTDNTLDELKKLKPVKIINFRKCFGQTAALDAAIKHARGDFIIGMDGDGQDDPHEMPKLYNKLIKDDLDVVSAWRKKRKDSFMKRTMSRLAARLRKFLIDDGIHDSGTTFKIYRKECFEHIDLYGEMHRFIPGLLKIKGFRIGELPVNHRAREHGSTKYNWKRGVKGILDMFSIWFWRKFANRPLHLFGASGAFLVFLGVAAFLVVLGQHIFSGKDLSDTALTLVSLIVALAGMHLFVFGLMADMLSKNHYASTKDVPYDIKETIENE